MEIKIPFVHAEAVINYDQGTQTRSFLWLLASFYGERQLWRLGTVNLPLNCVLKVSLCPDYSVRLS